MITNHIYFMFLNDWYYFLPFLRLYNKAPPTKFLKGDGCYDNSSYLMFINDWYYLYLS